MDSNLLKIFVTVADMQSISLAAKELKFAQCNRGKYNYKTLEFGSLETILGCVKAGMGITMLPINIVEKLGYSVFRLIRVHL